MATSQDRSTWREIAPQSAAVIRAVGTIRGNIGKRLGDAQSLFLSADLGGRVESDEQKARRRVVSLFEAEVEQHGIEVVRLLDRTELARQIQNLWLP